jgi:hypothetical protein
MACVNPELDLNVFTIDASLYFENLMSFVRYLNSYYFKAVYQLTIGMKIIAVSFLFFIFFDCSFQFL